MRTRQGRRLRRWTSLADTRHSAIVGCVGRWAAQLGVSTVAALAVASAAFAGAWPLPAGEGQVIVTVSTHSADQGFDDAGEAVAASFSKTEIAAYLEHGLSERWTLLARPAWQDVSLDGAREQGWAASELGLRRALWLRDGWALSGQVGAFAPGSAENRADARLGEGGAAIEGRGLVGRSWSGVAPGFVDVQAAWRKALDEVGDEARFDVTFGLGPVRDWSVYVQSFSLRREADLSARGLDSDRLAVSLVNDFSARNAPGTRNAWGHAARWQVGVLSTTGGRNVIDEKAVFASLWLRY